MMATYLVSIMLAFIARYESKKGLATSSSTYAMSGLIILPNFLFDIMTYCVDPKTIWFFIGDAILMLIMFMFALREREKKPAVKYPLYFTAWFL